MISARNVAAAANAKAAQQPGDTAAMRELGTAETMLTGSLGRLFALAEAYPDLKANQTMARLMEELTSTENKIAFARQLYNDVATQYNIKQKQVPTVLGAGIAGATPAPLWELTSEAERAVPKVEL